MVTKDTVIKGDHFVSSFLSAVVIGVLAAIGLGDGKELLAKFAIGGVFFLETIVIWTLLLTILYDINKRKIEEDKKPSAYDGG